MTAESRAAVALEACPFCGSAPRTYTYRTESLFSHDQVEFLTIICDDCDILMTGEQQDELRERWNRRAALSTPATTGYTPPVHGSQAGLDAFGYMRWTATSCMRCGYEPKDCTCPGGTVLPPTPATTGEGEVRHRIGERIAHWNGVMCSERPCSLERARAYGATVGLDEARNILGASATPATTGEGVRIDFVTAMGIARTGFQDWAAKPHNARWARKIDGTPIPNDLLVNVAMAFVHALSHGGEDGK